MTYIASYSNLNKDNYYMDVTSTVATFLVFKIDSFLRKILLSCQNSRTSLEIANTEIPGSISKQKKSLNLALLAEIFLKTGRKLTRYIKKLLKF